jgi:hypothetical protein
MKKKVENLLIGILEIKFNFYKNFFAEMKEVRAQDDPVNQKRKAVYTKIILALLIVLVASFMIQVAQQVIQFG